MPDKQIHPTGTVSTPAAYSVPDSAELLLKGVFASFDGSNASGDFRPLVRIVSDAGTVSLEAVSDTVVAAGASADASWFPHVGGGGGAAPTSTKLAFAQGYSDFTLGDGVQNVVAGGSANGSHAHVFTSDAVVMDWSSSVTPNDTLSFGPAGTYLVWSNVLWQFSDPTLTSQVMNDSILGVRHGPWQPLPGVHFVPSDGIATSLDFDVLHNSFGGGRTSVLHQNGTSFDAGVDAQFLTVVYLGTG